MVKIFANNRKKIITVVIILLLSFLLVLPYLLLKDRVKFAPAVFLTEFYKVIFVTIVVGLILKYIIDKIVKLEINRLLLNKEKQRILQLFDDITAFFPQNENKVRESISLVIRIVSDIKKNHANSDNINYFEKIYSGTISIKRKIGKYYKTKSVDLKKEMNSNILFDIERIKSSL